jgi:hypothetical protein
MKDLIGGRCLATLEHVGGACGPHRYRLSMHRKRRWSDIATPMQRARWIRPRRQWRYRRARVCRRLPRGEWFRARCRLAACSLTTGPSGRGDEIVGDLNRGSILKSGTTDERAKQRGVRPDPGQPRLIGDQSRDHLRLRPAELVQQTGLDPDHPCLFGPLSEKPAERVSIPPFGFTSELNTGFPINRDVAARSYAISLKHCNFQKTRRAGEALYFMSVTGGLNVRNCLRSQTWRCGDDMMAQNRRRLGDNYRTLQDGVAGRRQS